MKRTDVVEQAQAIRNSMDKVTENLTDADAVSVADLLLPCLAHMHSTTFHTIVKC